MSTLDAFLATAQTRAGAKDSEIALVEREIGQRLPDDYKAVLRRSNGLEGFVAPHAYLMLWSIDGIRSLNEAYSVAEFLPRVILIGTDGGDTGYGFAWEEATACYISVPLIGMEPKAVTNLGSALTDLMNRLRKEGTT
ncbi:SMI1/KNR4 family protein [Polyangium sorediatum]|uniref:SMI1/KNR4 family protein n=1 Tax=Polyangium sorediatum TaxID=889274 RepID=A0ABT6NWZ0_9BACT|nr:SMI1/KNR4 family protein [Polyangium sorediatum]MDI1432848.1 SMI1/KNR4 family protein [Polyangium sorediatum]